MPTSLWACAWLYVIEQGIAQPSSNFGSVSALESKTKALEAWKIRRKPALGERMYCDQDLKFGPDPSQITKFGTYN